MSDKVTELRTPSLVLVTEDPKPSESKSTIRIKLLIGLLTAIAPILVTCIQLFNTPSKVPESVVYKREQEVLFKKIESLEEELDDLSNSLFKFTLKTDFTLEQMENNLRRSLSAESPLIAEHVEGMGFAEEMSDITDIANEIAVLESTVDWDDYSDYAETLSGAAGDTASAIDDYLTGWIYLGSWNESKGVWEDNEIFTDLKRKVTLNDVITLSGSTYIRASKPSTLFLVEGDPIGPGILHSGSEVEIISLESAGLFSSFTWAKVHVIYESK